MSILPGVTISARLTHPDIRKSGRIYLFTAHRVEAIRKRRDLIEGLCRSVMNTGDGSSRAAFQFDFFDLMDAWTHSAHSYPKAQTPFSRNRHSSFSTWLSALRKLRPIGCFSVSGECE